VLVTLRVSADAKLAKLVQITSGSKLLAMNTFLPTQNCEETRNKFQFLWC
jgi:hypothetical protein